MADSQSVRAKEEMLRTQARSYKRKAEIMADAASIASGQGNYKLSNDCWAMQAHLKRRQTEVNEQICKLWNPAYPGKRS